MKDTAPHNMHTSSVDSAEPTSRRVDQLLAHYGLSH